MNPPGRPWYAAVVEASADESEPETLRARLSRLLDALVYPPRRRVGGEELRSARVAAATFLVGTFIAIPPLLDHLSKGELSLFGKLLIFSVANAALLIATRLGMPPRRAGLLMGLAGLLSLTLSAYEFGTLSSPPVLGMIILPFVIVYIGGVRLGALIAVGVLLVFASLGVTLADKPEGWEAQLIGNGGIMLGATLASIRSMTSAGRGPASAAATQSASSSRFFTPSTTVAIPSIDRA